MGTTLAVASVMAQTYAQNRSLIKQGESNRKTASNYIKAMNYSLQNYDMQRQDAFEAVVDELEQVKLQGKRVSSGVDNAVNESMMGGGRTADLLKRSAIADLARTTNQLKANYTKKRNEIDINKEATLLNTKGAISAIQDVEKPSLLSTLINIGTAYVGGLQAAEQVKAIQEKAGVNTQKPQQGTPAGNLLALEGLTGSTYKSPMTSTPLGTYKVKDTYEDLFGGNFKTGSFFDSVKWR